MAKGIDYAWHGTIDWNCLKSKGVSFICRYFSYDVSKDLTASELSGANSHGISVAVVWETTANRMLSGYNGGVTDAKESDKRCKSLGMNGCPVYFACDWDASESQQVTINAYLDGAVSVLGKARVGMYAGYYPIKRAFDAKKITYGWQTYAWSGGNWDNRAQLRQIQNGVTVCGISSDWDESHASDFAQWPRPGTKPPDKPPSTKAPVLHVDYFGPANGHNYTHPDVKVWQDKMYHRGWSIAVDQMYGYGSETVCRQFQSEKGLVADGMVGPDTWNATWDEPIT